MAGLDDLEVKLNDAVEKNTPKIPENGRRALVKYLPYLALIGGVLTLINAWDLWRAAHALSEISAAFGVTIASNISTIVWISLIVLLVESILYFLAYPGLKDRLKQGWNYLYYVALINVGYGVVLLFSDFGGASELLIRLLVSALGFYLLFQIREYYTGKKLVESSTGKVVDSTTVTPPRNSDKV